MKPANFPARKLRRQLIAEANAGMERKLDDTQRKLDFARGIRTKKNRSKP